jgi:uncharacterized membrane protein YidH (DUF202 family)
VTPPPPADDDDPEDTQPGLAKERTDMAWTRTAISFAATGAAILKNHAVAGAIVLALGVVTWWIRRLFVTPGGEQSRERRLLLVTVAVTAVGVVALVISLTARSKGLR